MAIRIKKNLLLKIIFAILLSFSVGQTIKFNNIKMAGCFIAHLNTNRNLRTFFSWFQGRIIFCKKIKSNAHLFI